MAEHLNDEEQVEALKKWWSENGKSVVGGVVLGLVWSAAGAVGSTTSRAGPRRRALATTR